MQKNLVNVIRSDSTHLHVSLEFVVSADRTHQQNKNGDLLKACVSMPFSMHYYLARSACLVSRTILHSHKPVTYQFC